MARPRVIISSIYHDLKYRKSSLENFVRSLGYDPIVLEMEQMHPTSNTSVEDHFALEAKCADMCLLLIGDGYEPDKHAIINEEYGKYEKIIKDLYTSLVSRDMPVYLAIEQETYAKYEKYIQVAPDAETTHETGELLSALRFIGDFISLHRNNPIKIFDKYVELEEWLREHLAVLFRDLLANRANHVQIQSLSKQLSELSAIIKSPGNASENLLRPQ